MQKLKCVRVIKKQKQDCKTSNECVRLLCKKKGDVRLAKYKNPEYISLLQSRATLARNLQNWQNVVVSLAPHHSGCSLKFTTSNAISSYFSSPPRSSRSNSILTIIRTKALRQGKFFSYYTLCFIVLIRINRLTSL